MSLFWTSAKVRLPDNDGLTLVTGSTHEGIALARFNEGQWDVQPFKDAWYQTETGIEDWTLLEDSRSDIKRVVYQSIKDIFEDLRLDENSEDKIMGQ